MTEISKKLRIEEGQGSEVVHLVLNSPGNLNAMDLEMAHAFQRAGEQLRSNDSLRVIVVRGEGRAFSAGGDLEMLRLKAEKTLGENEREMMDFYRSFLGLRDLNVPLVCALHGHVVGAGFCFAASCDIRVGDDTALMAAPFTRLALHPGMGGSYFLPRAFGSEVARELVLTGRRMNAEEAYRHGFLAHLTEAGKVSEAIDKVVRGILKGAPLATRAVIEEQRSQEAEMLTAHLRKEAREQARCYARQEFLDGVTALQKKQSPPWSP